MGYQGKPAPCGCHKWIRKVVGFPRNPARICSSCIGRSGIGSLSYSCSLRNESRNAGCHHGIQPPSSLNWIDLVERVFRGDVEISLARAALPGVASKAAPRCTAQARSTCTGVFPTRPKFRCRAMQPRGKPLIRGTPAAGGGDDIVSHVVAFEDPAGWRTAKLGDFRGKASGRSILLDV